MTKPASKTSEQRSKMIGESAVQFDIGEAAASTFPPRLAKAGLPAVGVPAGLGGSGRDVVGALVGEGRVG